MNYLSPNERLRKVNTDPFFLSEHKNNMDRISDELLEANTQLVNSTEYAVFQGISGNKYEFEVHSLIGSIFYNVGGVYIFVNKWRNYQNNIIWYKPLYIGQTHSFLDRINCDHEKLKQVIELDGKYVCLLRIEINDKFLRERIEEDIIRYYYPPLNKKRIPHLNR